MNTCRKTEYFRKRFNSFLNVFVPDLIDVVFLMISMLPEAVKAWASQYIPDHVFYVKLTTQYADVMKRIDAFLMYDIDRIYFNKALSKELLELHAKAHDLVVDMAPFIRDVSGEFSLLREQLRKFDKRIIQLLNIKMGILA